MEINCRTFESKYKFVGLNNKYCLIKAIVGLQSSKISDPTAVS